MSSTFIEVRDALATAASNADGVSFQAYPSDAFDAPGGYVMHTAFDPRVVFSGAKLVVTFRLWAVANGVDPVAAGLVLDALMDPFSVTGVPYAVQLAANWPSPAIVDYAQVVQIGEFTEVRQATESSRLFGIPFDVEVCW